MEAKTLFSRRSSRQQIDLFLETDGSISLTLDDYWQFSSRDEHVFHEMLVDTAMRVAPRRRSVLILGGGDGLAARNALRYSEVERVVLCEIDGDVIEMTREVPEMVALTEDCLSDARVEVIVDDALVYMDRSAEQFDVVVCDFPVAGDGRAAPSFDRRLCELLSGCAVGDGVVTVQVSQHPPEFWPVLAAFGNTFTWVQPRLAELGSDEWADFILASHGARTRQTSLATGLRFLTEKLAEETVITNRSGDRFQTRAYGAAPEPEDESRI